MDVYDVKRPGDDNVVWSYESYTLFDYQFESRFEAAKRVANETGRVLAPNLALETADSGLLCYTNLWDLRHAGNGLKPDSVMSKMLPDPLRGLYPGERRSAKRTSHSQLTLAVCRMATYRTLH